MKPLIGVLYRDSISSSKQPVSIVYNDIITSVLKSNGTPIGISPQYIDNYLNICNGFIIQGGDDISNYSLTAIKKIININKPILGICLGMQEMATIYNSSIKDFPNHKDENLLHEVIIKKNSLLYKILNTDKIIVNSRHKSAIDKTSLQVSSRSLDNIIESIENPNLNFFLGIQWHPENIYERFVTLLIIRLFK